MADRDHGTYWPSGATGFDAEHQSPTEPSMSTIDGPNGSLEVQDHVLDHATFLRQHPACIRILESLEDGSMSTAELATDTGLDEESVEMHLAQMQNLGLVKSNETTRPWYITEAGDLALAVVHNTDPPHPQG